MKKHFQYICLTTVGLFAFASCASDQTSSTTGVQAEGSGITDSSQVNGGPGAAAGAPIGIPGR